MSKVFFEDLDLPEPHYFLGVGSGSHAEQTAKIMMEFEKVLLKEKPDWVAVFGDVNSTLACSVTAKKVFIPVAHIEAGLRSFDMTMPEEINRKVTDAISDMLFTPSEDGNKNLLKEGIQKNKIYFVGNIMIDSLVAVLKKMNAAYENRILRKFDLEKENFVLVTLHRPSNVDDKKTLWEILNLLNSLSLRIPVIFPMHPRTRKNINNLEKNHTRNDQLRMVDPLRYKEFIILEKTSKCVLTDSGGIQEETTYLKIPCITLRKNTERPITVIEGTNELGSIRNIKEKIEIIFSGKWKQGSIPDLWDGKTAKRIVRILREMEL
jgi:UDP-N-acetylglucosamine 2-epimerase (non-hydrolysing)